jgi:hypothetical protein
MATHTPEQRAIIARMGALSTRINSALAADAEEYGKMRLDLLNISTSLAAAMRRSNEIHTLCQQHGDAFREYLDTL